MKAPWPIEAVAKATGQELSPSVVSALRTWLDLLERWNARVDLTAARSPAELTDVMLTDALICSLHLPPRAHVVDIGSGAGAPGLPLALLRPDLTMTLVEPLGKRAAFLRTALSTLRRLDVSVRPCRAEPLIQQRETFDVALGRAVLPPPAWLSLGASLIHPEGSVWVHLAKEEPPELEGMHPQEIFSYHSFVQHAPRSAVRYGKREPQDRVSGRRAHCDQE